MNPNALPPPTKASSTSATSIGCLLISLFIGGPIALIFGVFLYYAVANYLVETWFKSYELNASLLNAIGGPSFSNEKKVVTGLFQPNVSAADLLVKLENSSYTCTKRNTPDGQAINVLECEGNVTFDAFCRYSLVLNAEFDLSGRLVFVAARNYRNC